MIFPQELRKAARERRASLDLVEKDYILGWLLKAIFSTTASTHIAFKGGTAISKVYFPGNWRLSEDLDFTMLDNTGFEDMAENLISEIPAVLFDIAGIRSNPHKEAYTNPNYLQVRFQYTGPVSRNTVKIEISREKFVGPLLQKFVPQIFDCTKFSVTAYSLQNILAEKIRTLLQRGKLKDYYDVWKLLRTRNFDSGNVKDLFYRKCISKGVVYNGIDQFFPPDLIDTLGPYMKIGLTRLTSEDLPNLGEMIEELKDNLGALLA